MAHQHKNTWSLCKSHCGCKKCQNTLTSWKKKSATHAFNAQRTKFALMCFLEGNQRPHPVPQEEGEPWEAIPIDEDPVFLMTEDKSIEDQKKANELYRCGICDENCVKVGAKKPIIYQCGHTNCATCINQWAALAQAAGNPISCPYCRQEIIKAIRLFTD